MLKRIAALLAMLCILPSCAAPAESDSAAEKSEEISLTLAVENGISEYAAAGVECFVQKVNELSDGKMTIELLSCDDPLEKLEEGCPLVFGSNEEFARANGNFSAYTSPFYFYDYKHLTLTLNSPEYYEIIRNGNVSLMNAMPIAAFYDGCRAILSAREGMFDTISQFPGSIVNILEDQPLLEMTLEAFGADLKQRKEEYILQNFAKRRDIAVAECDMTKLDKVIVDEKAESFYLCKSFHYAHINWLMLSQSVEARLSDRQLAVLTEAAAYAIAKNDSLVLEREEAGLDAMEKRGALIVAPAYGEFNEAAMNVIKNSSKYGSLWEWDQYSEVRNLALKRSESFR